MFGVYVYGVICNKNKCARWLKIKEKLHKLTIYTFHIPTATGYGPRPLKSLVSG